VNPDGEDWKKRLKSLGITRKRKKKEDLLGKKEKERSLEPVSPEREIP
jgi:hypothetical protein